MLNSDQLRKASTANDVGRHDLAQQLAVQAIGMAPGNPECYGELARACIGLSQYKDAETNSRHGLELDPANDWLMQLLILALCGQKRFEDALPVAEILVESFPDRWHTHLRKGKVLSGLGRHDEAVTFFGTAVRLGPDESATHFGLGMGLMNLEKFPEAEQHFRTSLKLSPNDAMALNNLGVCLQHQKKMKDAALAFNAAILIDPTQATTKSNAKYAISQFLASGAILAVLIQLVAMAGFFLLYGSKLDPTTKGMITLAGGLLTVALMAAAIFGGRRIRTRQLESADPQVLAIYQALTRDRTVD